MTDLSKSEFYYRDFKKEDVCKGYLCELIKDEGYAIVYEAGCALGVMDNNLFLDFMNQKLYEVIDSDTHLEDKKSGTYFTFPTKIYENDEGYIKPINVFYDLKQNDSKFYRNVRTRSNK